MEAGIRCANRSERATDSRSFGHYRRAVPSRFNPSMRRCLLPVTRLLRTLVSRGTSSHGRPPPSPSSTWRRIGQNLIVRRRLSAIDIPTHLPMSD
jgi:hypothetical protein